MNSGEARYFRDWPTLEGFVEGLIVKLDPEISHADEVSETDETTRTT